MRILGLFDGWFFPALECHLCAYWCPCLHTKASDAPCKAQIQLLKGRALDLLPEYCEEAEMALTRAVSECVCGCTLKFMCIYVFFDELVSQHMHVCKHSGFINAAWCVMFLQPWTQVKLDPDMHDGWVALGHVLWKKGDLSGSQNCFRQALEKQVGGDGRRTFHIPRGRHFSPSRDDMSFFWFSLSLWVLVAGGLRRGQPGTVTCSAPLHRHPRWYGAPKKPSILSSSQPLCVLHFPKHDG